MLFQLIISGLALGGLYTVFAMGIILPFNVFKIPWFAHASVVVWGGYFAFVCYYMLGLNLWIALLAAIIFCSLISIIMEIFCIKRLMKLHPLELFVAIWGMYIVLQNLIVNFFGIYDKSLPAIAPFLIEVGGIRISVQNIIAIFLGFSFFIAIFIFLKRSKTGKAMRAVSQDIDTAEILGIATSKMRTYIFIISGALAAIAGVLFGSFFHLSPYLADYLIMKIFIIVILGGFGNVLGTLVSSYSVGISESLIGFYISSEFKDFFLFMFAIIFLLIKPKGAWAMERRT